MVFVIINDNTQSKFLFLLKAIKFGKRITPYISGSHWAIIYFISAADTYSFNSSAAAYKSS